MNVKTANIIYLTRHCYACRCNRWYFIDVDGRITLDVADRLKRLILDPKWEGVLEDVYCPLKVPYVRFKEGKLLQFVPAVLYPGHMFIKCTMSPDIADRLETVSGVMRMRVNEDGFLVPLTIEEVRNLEVQREEESLEFDRMTDILETGNYYVPETEGGVGGSRSEADGGIHSTGGYVVDTVPTNCPPPSPDYRIRKGGCVSILEGSYAGCWGIARGTEMGQIAIDVIDQASTHRVLLDLSAVQYRPPVSK
jgi:transcription antitermination factor NusG